MMTPYSEKVGDSKVGLGKCVSGTRCRQGAACFFHTMVQERRLPYPVQRFDKLIWFYFLRFFIHFILAGQVKLLDPKLLLANGKCVSGTWCRQGAACFFHTMVQERRLPYPVQRFDKLIWF